MGRIVLKIGRLKLDGTHLINVISRPSVTPRVPNERTTTVGLQPSGGTVEAIVTQSIEVNHQATTQNFLSPPKTFVTPPVVVSEPKVVVFNKTVEQRVSTENSVLPAAADTDINIPPTQQQLSSDTNHSAQILTPAVSNIVPLPAESPSISPEVVEVSF